MLIQDQETKKQEIIDKKNEQKQLEKDSEKKSEKKSRVLPKYHYIQQQQKSSPTFSPLTSQNRNYQNNIFARSRHDQSNPTVQVFTDFNINQQQFLNDYKNQRRYKSRYDYRSIIGQQSSPYKRTHSKRNRQLSLLGKENTNGLTIEKPAQHQIVLNKINISQKSDPKKQSIRILQNENRELRIREEVYKKEIKKLNEQIQRHLDNNFKASQMQKTELQNKLQEFTVKYQVINKQNIRLLADMNILKNQFLRLKEKVQVTDLMHIQIMKELGIDNMNDIITAFKKISREYSICDKFIQGIKDMKVKITGRIQQQSLKILWKWLKNIVQQYKDSEQIIKQLKKPLELRDRPLLNRIF